MLDGNQLYEALVEALPASQISSWQSDMYVAKNKTTTDLIAQYEYKQNVSTFKDAIDKKPWYDIPFIYQPFWEKTCGNKEDKNA